MLLPGLAKAQWLDYNPKHTGRGSARLERTVRVREVPSSNLGAPTRPNVVQNLLWFILKEISFLSTKHAMGNISIVCIEIKEYNTREFSKAPP